MKSDRFRQIEAILRLHRDELTRDYGVTEIGVFGSVAILISFDRPVGFFKFLELEERLGEWLGGKVDLVTREALKPNIGQHILNDLAMI